MPTPPQLKGAWAFGVYQSPAYTALIGSAGDDIGYARRENLTDHRCYRFYRCIAPRLQRLQ
jgi:hypothetical protein